MRILVYGLSGHLCGGIETFLLNINKNMSNHCIYDYIILGGVCVQKDQIAKKGGEVFKLPTPKRHPISYIKGLCRLLKQQKSGIDVFYYNLNSMVNALPALLARIYGYKVVLHAHNSGLQNNGLLYKCLHRIGKILLSGKNYTRWSNSFNSATFMFGKGVPAQIIYNAIAPARFGYNQEKREKIRSHYALDNTVIFGFVGRLEAPKNLMFLLDIFSEIKKIEPQTVLWVIGEGSLKAAMEKKIMDLQMEDAVVMFGSRSDISDLMQGMDLFLLPSLFEGLGIVLVEAQAAGLPCVTSKDVVSQIVNVTQNVRYISLNVSAAEWAGQCMTMLETDISRSLCSIRLEYSCFHINKEARRIEKLFLDISIS